jgi:hypothetical protein
MAESMILSMLKTPQQVREEQLNKLRQQSTAQANLLAQPVSATTALPGLIRSFAAGEMQQQAVDLNKAARRASVGFGGLLSAAGQKAAGDVLKTATLTAEEQQAAKGQEAIKDVDYNNPESMKLAAKRLQEAGLNQAGAQLAQQAQALDLKLRQEERADAQLTLAKNQDARSDSQHVKQMQVLDSQIKQLQQAQTDRANLAEIVPETVDAIPEAFMSSGTKAMLKKLPPDKALPFIMDAQAKAQAKASRDSYYNRLSTSIFADTTITTTNEDGEQVTVPNPNLTNNQRINKIKAAATQARRDNQPQAAEDLEAMIPLISGGLSFEDIGKKSLEFKEKYESDPRIKGVEESLRAAQQVMASAAMTTGAGDIATIFQFMKALDPNSVVRESEFALAESMGSLYTKLEVLANKAKDGQRLTNSQRQQIVDLTSQLAIQTATYGNEVRDRERNAYDTMGLNLDVITGTELFSAPDVPDMFSQETRESEAATASQEETQVLMEVWDTNG